MTQHHHRPETTPQPPPSGSFAPGGQGSPASAPQAAPARTRRPLIIALVAVAIGALLLVLLAVGTVTYLVMQRGGQPEPGAAPEAPAYEAPLPLTRVGTEDYAFSYPRAWAEQDVSDLLPVIDYALRAQDATDTTRLLIMDYVVEGTVEEECAAQAEEARFAPMPPVEIDGRAAQHFQDVYEHSETGEPVVGDLWCTTSSQFHVLVIVAHTTGPEAEAAGISEGQRIVDSWRWAGEDSAEDEG